MRLLRRVQAAAISACPDGYSLRVTPGAGADPPVCLLQQGPEPRMYVHFSRAEIEAASTLDDLASCMRRRLAKSVEILERASTEEKP